MRRWDHILAVLTEFETYFTDRVPKPFSIVRAADVKWTPEENARLAPLGYPTQLAGVYFYVDVCTADDIHGDSPAGQERFSVIRKLGSATNSFYDRVRKAHWKQPGGHYLLFRHRWIDIIPIDEAYGFVTVALEDFLLQRIRTEMDEKRVPSGLLAQKPLIYDEES